MTLLNKTQIVFGLTLLCCATASGQAGMTMSPDNQVPAGFHEFELFGNETLYLSHYPMFGSIHSYQVLLEVTLREAEGSDVKAQYLALRKSNPSASFGVSPETADAANHYWVLPETVKPGASFQANVHWQKGTAHPAFIAHHVTVDIVKVVYFRLFHPDDQKPEFLTYLLFGKGQERYLAHYIASHPDFDQVMAVSTDAAGERASSDGGAAVKVTIPGRSDKSSLRLLEAAQPVTGKLEGGAEVNLRVGSLVHYEPGLEIQK